MSKRLAHAQQLRDAFPETESCAVIERWATERIPQILLLANTASTQRANLIKLTYTQKDAMSPPSEPFQILQQLQEMYHRIYTEAEVVRTVITVRIPELKEEDNLGVAVQHGVLKWLDEMESKVMGGSGGGEKGGMSPAIGIYAPRDYVAARAVLEDKIIGKTEGGDAAGGKGGSQSPSLLLELKMTDADFMLKAELAATHMATTLRAFVNAYALNWKKLIQPRSGGERMVS